MECLRRTKSQRWQSYTALQIGKLTQEKADIVDAHSIEMREMQERLRRSRPAMSDAHNRTRAHTHLRGGRSVRGRGSECVVGFGRLLPALLQH